MRAEQRRGGWWEINGGLTDMLLKLKRAKFCFLCLRLLPSRLVLLETVYLIRQENGGKTHKQKPKGKIGFVRLFSRWLPPPLWRSCTVSSGAVGFPCALLCWSGNTTTSLNQAKYKIYQLQRLRRRADEGGRETRGGGGARLPSAGRLFKIKEMWRGRGAEFDLHNFSFDWTQMNGPDCSSMICFTWS